MHSAGVRAPDFFLTSLSGRQETLSDLLGKAPILLAFYKASCPVCQMTLPYLDRLSGSCLPVIAVSQDDAAGTERFRQRFGLAIPALLDREQDGYPASNALGITNVPSLFLIEPDGAISMAGSGFSKTDLDALGRRAGVSIFRPEEKVPEWKAG
jgi:peroxiredoxin